MKIIDRNDGNKVAYNTVKEGTVFKIGGRVLMKIPAITDEDGHSFESINLKDGEPESFWGTDLVEILPDATLTLYKV